MKEIRPTQLEKIEKSVLGLFSVPIFGPNFLGEGVEIRKSADNIFRRERPEDSENRHRFLIALFVPEI